MWIIVQSYFNQIASFIKTNPINYHNTNKMRQVLVITSSSSDLQLESGKKVATGFFLSELMVPVQKMRAAGFDIHYANPSGTEPSLDPFSDRSAWFKFK